MDTKQQLQQLIDNYANDDYILQCTGLSRNTISNARLGIFGTEFDPPAPKPPKPVATKKELVPVTRPFPSITDDMTDGQRILVLTKHGIAARKIIKYLSVPHSEHSINKYVTKKLGPARKGNMSAEHQISVTFMPYVVEALARLGKDRFTCELCLEPVPKGCQIHHTKYEGATVYDLMYICNSCNLTRENKGLT